MDFSYTSDDEIFCVHAFEHHGDYSVYNRPTLEEVKNMKLYGKYTPIVLDWLFEKLVEFPNVKIIYDAKSNRDEILRKIISEAEEFDIDIKDRFIVQVYSIENYEFAREFDFREYWYTNYISYYTPEQLKYFEDKPDVTTMVIGYYEQLYIEFVNNNYKTSKKVAIYTVNNKETWNYFGTLGVDYIYIDFY